MSLNEALRERELVVFLGQGGVGKTTLAAAAAVAASRTRRTLVVTVDPAKRLASALKLEVGHQVTNVRPNLDAVMVDTKQALDDLLERYAPSRERLDRILASPLYQHMSDALAGSEEFAAMGLLHEFVVSGDHDLIVVDTPPSSHALDFLNVNKRLLRVFDSGTARLMFQPGKLFALAGGRLANVLARWTSREYLDDLSYFMLNFEGMFQDMESRVRTMESVLADASRTAIGVVAVPEPGIVRETLRLVRGLTDHGFDPRFAIANRVWPPLMPGPRPDEAEHILDHYAALARIHQQGILRLQEEVGRVRSVPVMPELAGLDGMERLADILLDGDGHTSK